MHSYLLVCYVLHLSLLDDCGGYDHLLYLTVSHVRVVSECPRVQLHPQPEVPPLVGVAAEKLKVIGLLGLQEEGGGEL